MFSENNVCWCLLPTFWRRNVMQNMQFIMFTNLISDRSNLSLLLLPPLLRGTLGKVCNPVTLSIWCTIYFKSPLCQNLHKNDVNAKCLKLEDDKPSTIVKCKIMFIIMSKIMLFFYETEKLRKIDEPVAIIPYKGKPYQKRQCFVIQYNRTVEYMVTFTGEKTICGRISQYYIQQLVRRN